MGGRSSAQAARDCAGARGPLGAAFRNRVRGELSRGMRAIRLGCACPAARHRHAAHTGCGCGRRPLLRDHRCLRRRLVVSRDARRVLRDLAARRRAGFRARGLHLRGAPLCSLRRVGVLAGPSAPIDVDRLDGRMGHLRVCSRSACRHEPLGPLRVFAGQRAAADPDRRSGGTVRHRPSHRWRERRARRPARPTIGGRPSAAGARRRDGDGARVARLRHLAIAGRRLLRARRCASP